MTCTWYLAIIPARNISKFSKYNLDNFENIEISLAVLLPNTTTRHAITYTNSEVKFKNLSNSWMKTKTRDY